MPRSYIQDLKSRVSRSRALVWGCFAIFAAISVWLDSWLEQYIREISIPIYHRYAVFVWSSSFHRWPTGYPALSLIVFLAPLLLLVAYKLGFALLTFAALAIMLYVGMKRHNAAWGFRVLGYLGIGTILLFSRRYDIFPTLVAFLAIDQAIRRNWRWAWVWSILGFLLKLWPAVLWPIFLIAEYRETGSIRWRGLALGAVAEGAVVGVQEITAPHQALTSFLYLLNRPIEFESLAASVTSLIGSPHAFFAFGSYDISDHGLAHDTSAAITALGVCAVLSVLWALWKGRLDLVDAAILCLGIVLLTSKVFSPQYLIWLAPWLALRRSNPFLVLAYLATAMSYLAFLTGVGIMQMMIVPDTRNVFLLLGLLIFAKEALSRQTSAQPTSDLEVLA